MIPASVVAGNIGNKSAAAVQLNLTKTKTPEYTHCVLFPTDGRVLL